MKSSQNPGSTKQPVGHYRLPPRRVSLKPSYESSGADVEPPPVPPLIKREESSTAPLNSRLPSESNVNQRDRLPSDANLGASGSKLARPNRRFFIPVIFGGGKPKQSKSNMFNSKMKMNQIRLSDIVDVDEDGPVKGPEALSLSLDARPEEIEQLQYENLSALKLSQAITLRPRSQDFEQMEIQRVAYLPPTTPVYGQGANVNLDAIVDPYCEFPRRMPQVEPVRTRTPRFQLAEESMDHKEVANKPSSEQRLEKNEIVANASNVSQQNHKAQMSDHLTIDEKRTMSSSSKPKVSSATTAMQHSFTDADIDDILNYSSKSSKGGTVKATTANGLEETRDDLNEVERSITPIVNGMPVSIHKKMKSKNSSNKIFKPVKNKIKQKPLRATDILASDSYKLSDRGKTNFMYRHIDQDI